MTQEFIFTQVNTPWSSQGEFWEQSIVWGSKKASYFVWYARKTQRQVFLSEFVNVLEIFFTVVYVSIKIFWKLYQ